ncbi:MAG: helix-turn-helix transcriptional regulator [Bacteroidales bacterium]|nr:helix-turn-helix transcriptional regulator [Bacteroidales bacterium]
MATIANPIILNKDFFSAISNGKENNGNIITENFVLIRNSDTFSLQTDGNFVKIIHPQLELVLSGNADYFIDYQVYHVQRCNLIIYPQYTLWKCENRSKNFSSVWFDCNFEEIYDYEVLYNLEVINNLNNKDFNYIVNCFDILHLTAGYNDPALKSVKYSVMSLINLINVNIERHIQSSDISYRSLELYKQFMKLLRQNYDFSLSYEDYSSQLCISKSHLRNIVKQITGKSITKVINAEIIRKSKMLLSENITVKDITEKLKFENYEYFHQFFKSETGFTPSEFVKMKTRI